MPSGAHLAWTYFVVRWHALLLILLVLVVDSTASAQDSPGFVLETGSPDAFCPDLSQTRAAVTRRLGALQVDGHRGWRARYTIGHAPTSTQRDFVRLELFGPEDTVELVRDLPMAGESCSTMAEVIALVLDRHFRGLSRDEHVNVSIEAAPAEQSATARTPEPAAPIVTPQSSPTTVERPRSSRFVLSLEVTDSWRRALPTLSARGRLLIGSHVLAAFSLGFDLKSEQQALSRQASVSAWGGEASGLLAYRHALGTSSAYLGAGLLARLQRGQSEGLANGATQTRGVWAGVAEAGWLLPFAEGWWLSALTRGSVAIPAVSGQFIVQNREVLQPKVVDLSFGLGLGYSL